MHCAVIVDDRNLTHRVVCVCGGGDGGRGRLHWQCSMFTQNYKEVT